MKKEHQHGPDNKSSFKAFNVFKIVTNGSTYLLPPRVALTARVAEFL